MKIIVEDFGKIAHAEVEVGDLTIFVGENNSGKTFLMQLIYGTLNIIANYNRASECFHEFSEVVNDDMRKFFSEYPVVINNENIYILEDFINRFLEKNKDSIVMEIFKKEIQIGHLSVRFDSLSYEYEWVKEESPADDITGESKSGQKWRYCLLANRETIRRTSYVDSDEVRFKVNIKGKEKKLISLSEANILICSRGIIDHIVNNGRTHSKEENISLYLPASRSGLLLLYPFFYENRNDDVFGEYMQDESENAKYIENKYGLTQPVYDFLDFLLTYKYSEINSKNNSELISFISDKMIEGTIYKKDSEIMYKPHDSEKAFPATHSSSSINEISPVVLLLDSVRNFKYVFYDEVETCQHPKMQIQTARLITRMVNGGFRMILSTHSLAMAAAVNNHIMLSSSPVKDATVQKLGYTEDDILKSSNVHAYQMAVRDGKTYVEELKQNPELGIGFNFGTFADPTNEIAKINRMIWEDGRNG